MVYPVIYRVSTIQGVGKALLSDRSASSPPWLARPWRAANALRWRKETDSVWQDLKDNDKAKNQVFLVFVTNA